MRHHIQLVRLLLAVFAICASLTVISAQEVTGSVERYSQRLHRRISEGRNRHYFGFRKKVVLRTTATNDNGEYSAPNLPSGVYDITVEAPGFKKHIETGLKLNVSDKRAVDVTLEAGTSRKL